MDEKYVPPFDLTDEIANLTIEICSLLKQMQISSNLSRNPILRKQNRIRTIHSSLAIEHNSLTEDQVTAVIEGKHVIAPQRDIKEVQNAYEVYERMYQIDPYSIDDLLSVHGIMMETIVKDAGHFRSGAVGVYKGSQLIHMGTRPEYVEHYISQLMSWTKESDLHPLIKSCIFHYEFEYIHPFSDGNGRTGRFWHTLLLSKWNPVFSWLPIESMIHRNQNEYYKAIADSDNSGKSTVFITFMLKLIKSVVEDNVGINVVINVGIKDQILVCLRSNPHMSARAIAAAIGFSQRQVERAIAQLKKENRLTRVGSNKSGWWQVNQ